MKCAGAGNELESEAPIADRIPAHSAPAAAGSFHRGRSAGVRAEPVCGGATRAAAGGAAWARIKGC